MTILTKAFWTATTERAIKTVAQTAASVGLVGATGLLDVDWAAVGSVAGLAGIVSVLTSIASGHVAGPGPSLANEVAVTDEIG